MNAFRVPGELLEDNTAATPKDRESEFFFNKK